MTHILLLPQQRGQEAGGTEWTSNRGLRTLHRDNKCTWQMKDWRMDTIKGAFKKRRSITCSQPPYPTSCLLHICTFSKWGEQGLWGHWISLPASYQQAKSLRSWDAHISQIPCASFPFPSGTWGHPVAHSPCLLLVCTVKLGTRRGKRRCWVAEGPELALLADWDPVI